MDGVIAPSVESLHPRLDAVEKDLRENRQSIDRLDTRVDRLTERMEAGFTRLNARVDHLGERMEKAFSRMDSRLDTLTAAILSIRQPTNPDAIITRLEKLEREIEVLRKQG